MSILTFEPIEKEFNWKYNNKEYPVIMVKPKEICDCDWNLFADIEDNIKEKNLIYNNFIDSIDISGDYFLKQTNCGNCFLVSSIISLINIPGILYELFFFGNKNKKNFTHNDEYIYLYCYIKGIRKVIKIKNTYPIYKNEEDKKKYIKEYCSSNKVKSYSLSKIYAKCSPIIFATSIKGILLGQALIKAFVCSAYLEPEDITIFNLENCIFNLQNAFNLPIFNIKGLNNCVNNMMGYNISELYKQLNKGLLPEYPMNLFLGCISEFILNNKQLKEEDNKNIIKKIIKYINLGGFIEVGTKSHSYSLQNYLEIEEEDNIHYYFSILNPQRGGESFEIQGINEYNDITIETNNPKLKKGCEARNYEKVAKIKTINERHVLTGHMVLKDNVLINWFKTLTFSESMFGAKNILIKIQENEIIKIKVKKITKICVTITFFNNKMIELNDINDYVIF